VELRRAGSGGLLDRSDKERSLIYYSSLHLLHTVTEKAFTHLA